MNPRFVSVREMRRIDHIAVKKGIPIEFMMENAGKALALHLKSKFKDLSKKKIVCVAGKGNNGGGVIASIRHLLYFGANVTLLLPYPNLTKPSKFHLLLLKDPKVRIIKYGSKNHRSFLSAILSADIIVDGIFGTGFLGKIKEPIYCIISAINKSHAYLLSNDIPSGMNADTGLIGNIAVKSDFIIVLHRPKRWMQLSKISQKKYTVESIGI